MLFRRIYDDMLPMRIASGDFVFVGALGRPDLLEAAAFVLLSANRFDGLTDGPPPAF